MLLQTFDDSCSTTSLTHEKSLYMYVFVGCMMTSVPPCHDVCSPKHYLVISSISMHHPIQFRHCEACSLRSSCWVCNDEWSLNSLSQHLFLKVLHFLSSISSTRSFIYVMVKMNQNKLSTLTRRKYSRSPRFCRQIVDRKNSKCNVCMCPVYITTYHSSFAQFCVKRSDIGKHGLNYKLVIRMIDLIYTFVRNYSISLLIVLNIFQLSYE